MSEESLLQWLNKRTSASITSADDIKISRQICYFLINLTGKPQLAPKIAIGKTPFERSSNFQIVKTLFGSELDLPFNHSIAKLVEGDKEEILGLLSELQSLEEPNDDDDEDIPLDSLLDALQDDLVNKMRECVAFRDEMDRVSVERDFYCDKLRRILRESAKYNPDDADTVLKIVKTPPVDFLPPN